MGSFIRWVAIAIGALVLLVVAAVGIFVATFDANDLKDQLVAATKEQTGRELTIEGDIKLSVFPYVGFSLGATRLADGEGWGDEPFLAFDGAAASVRLLPLFTGKLEVGEVRLEGLSLKAVTAANDTNNWDDLVAIGQGDAPPAESSESSSEFDLANVTVGGVKLADAQLSYEDKGEGTRYAITDWDLTTGAFRLGQPLDIDTSLQLEAKNPDLAGTITARGTVIPNESRTVLNNPDLTVQVSGEMLEALSALNLQIEAEQLSVDKSGPFDLKAPVIRAKAESGDFGEPLDARIEATSLSGDLKSETLSLTNLTATAWDMKMRGELQGKNVLSKASINGKIAIDEFSPKSVAEKAGAPLSPTVDPKALTRAALSGNFAITQTSARFSGLELTLDDTKFTGDLAVADFDRQALRFDLKGDQLILDRYMAPAPEQPVAVDPDAVAIPAEDIRKADIDGKLSLGTLMLSGLTATNAEVTLKASNGTLRIHPSTADMYGGKYQGDIRIDASGELPVLSLNERLQKVDFGALGKDVFDQQNLTGQLDGRITLKGMGVTQTAILNTLGGDAQFSFLDGAIVGIDIAHEVQKGMAAIGRGAAPSGNGDGRTEFAELSGTAQMTDGVMTNNDLIARLPFILVGGKGTVNLPEDTVKYRLDMQFQKSPELPDGASDLLGLNLPIVLSGNLSQPGPGWLDFGGTAGALVKQRAEEEVDKLKDKVLGGLLGGGSEDGEEGGEDDAKSDVKKVLGGLFGGKKKDKDDDGDN
ncbi:MAG: AsmA family protein [Pseudomonadota bacterium]